jgi:hypothetical protein
MKSLVTADSYTHGPRDLGTWDLGTWERTLQSRALCWAVKLYCSMPLSSASSTSCLLHPIPYILYLLCLSSAFCLLCISCISCIYCICLLLFWDRYVYVGSMPPLVRLAWGVRVHLVRAEVLTETIAVAASAGWVGGGGAEEQRSRWRWEWEWEWGWGWGC